MSLEKKKNQRLLCRPGLKLGWTKKNKKDQTFGKRNKSQTKSQKQKRSAIGVLTQT